MQIEIFTKAAQHIGAEIVFHTESPLSGQIILPNGHKNFFLRSDIGLNGMASGELVQNKHLCGQVLRKLGFNSPETLKLNLGSDTTFNDRQTHDVDYDKISSFVATHEFPLFLKPNIGTEGVGVYKVKSMAQIEEALSNMENIPAVILQKPCRGDEEYRVMVLEGKIELAYKRQPFELTGNGVSTIDTLLDLELERLHGLGGEISLDVKDKKIDFQLATYGYTRKSIPDLGTKIQPLPNVNLSEGAIPVECTRQIDEHFGPMCERIYREIGLTYFGLDLMVDWNADTPDYDIIEINRRPGFANFAAFNEPNKQLVQNIINHTFEVMAKRNGYDYLAHLFAAESMLSPAPQMIMPQPQGLSPQLG
jgi:hypothetical protein